MIQVKAQLNTHGITEYHSQGHAHKEQGLIVCNGLSAMEYQFLYAVKGLCPQLTKSHHSGISFQVNKGDFRIKLEGIPKDEEAQNYWILSQSLVIGVEMLKKHHPDQINVRILDNR